MENLLLNLCNIEGISGNESKIAEFTKSELEKYSKVKILKTKSVLATLGNEKSEIKILLDAHIDQVGFVVTDIDENGFLKIASCGGNDRRIMPGAVVRVFGKEEVIGVISCLPPHLVKNSDSKLPQIDEMSVDLGMPKEYVENIVSLGDTVIYNSSPKKLLDSKVASKAIDNRASVAALIRCAEMISQNKNIMDNCLVSILLSSQEETSSLGAMTSAYNDDYSESIVVDVSFAVQPDVSPLKAGKLSEGPMIGISPILSKDITNKLFDIAKKNNIPYQTEVMGSSTGTNADKISTTKSGICTGLVSIPERNMHTAIEVVDIQDIENTAKLLSLYIESRCTGK